MDPTADSLPRRAGVGLKADHYRRLLAGQPADGPHWLEIHPQNYFGAGGPPHHWLAALADIYPISFHSTGLSPGSADGVDPRQLDMLAALAERYPAAMISDHLSWSAVGPGAAPDLFPLPYTDEALDCAAAAVGLVQDRLKRPILIENPSRYFSFAGDDLSEIDFLHLLCRRSGCFILLDINNLFVSATNAGSDPQGALDSIDPTLVREIHLAGHARERHAGGDLLLDDHGHAVCPEVWALFRRFVARAGPRPTLIEWDAHVPDFATLAAEAAFADAILIDELADARAA